MRALGLISPFNDQIPGDPGCGASMAEFLIEMLDLAGHRWARSESLVELSEVAERAFDVAVARAAFLGRELTKLHEQAVHATLGGLCDKLTAGDIVQKGEFVVVVAGTGERTPTSIDVDRLLVELADKLPGKEVAKVIARATGEKRNTLYGRLLELRKSRQ